MPNKIKLLFVDDEERFLRTLTKRLNLRDFDVTATQNAEEALSAMDVEKFDLAIVDLKMPGMNGQQLLSTMKKRQPDIEIIILTGHGSIESAQACTREGSFCYLQKPCETKELLGVLKAAYMEAIRKKTELNALEMAEILTAANEGSSLAILRKLKALSDKMGKHS